MKKLLGYAALVLAGAVVVKVAGDVAVKLHRERRRDAEATMGTVVAMVRDITSPLPNYEMVGDTMMPVGSTTQSPLLFNHPGAQKVVSLPDGSTAVVTPPVARPAWADPHSEPDPDPDLVDPFNLDQPLDWVDPDLMAVGRLNAIYVDPAPEAEGRESGNGRVASFAPGENPLADIGEEPSWEQS